MIHYMHVKSWVSTQLTTHYGYVESWVSTLMTVMRELQGISVQKHIGGECWIMCSIWTHAHLIRQQRPLSACCQTGAQIIKDSLAQPTQILPPLSTQEICWGRQKGSHWQRRNHQAGRSGFHDTHQTWEKAEPVGLWIEIKPNATATESNLKKETKNINAKTGNHY